jgi:hypothetical protein
MSGGAYASVNVWQCMLDVRKFKKMRVAGPPGMALISGAVAYQITGFGQLHAVLMRIAYAQNEHEVLGLDLDSHFDVDEVEWRVREAVGVLRRDNVKMVHPVFIPISRKAMIRLRWASNTILRELDMIARTLVARIARAKWLNEQMIDVEA